MGGTAKEKTEREEKRGDVKSPYPTHTAPPSGEKVQVSMLSPCRTLPSDTGWSLSVVKSQNLRNLQPRNDENYRSHRSMLGSSRVGSAGS